MTAGEGASMTAGEGASMTAGGGGKDDGRRGLYRRWIFHR